MSNKAQHWKEELLSVYNAIAQESEDALPFSSGKYAHLFTDGSIFPDRGDETYPDLATCRARVMGFARRTVTVRQARCSGLFPRVYRLDFAELEKA